MIVACLGDSITAGSPLWDPGPGGARAASTRRTSAASGSGGRRAATASLELRNHGVYGERTDEIAARLETAVEGADALVVQGGINDVVQRRPVEEARAQPRRHGRARHARLGLRVALADVLPWNNGDGRAGERHRRG